MKKINSADMKEEQAGGEPTSSSPLCQLKRHFGKVHARVDVVELRLRVGRRFSSPCPPAVRLAERFKAHSPATGAAPNCFSFQTWESETQRPGLPLRTHCKPRERRGGMGRKHAFHPQDDESSS